MGTWSAPGDRSLEGAVQLGLSWLVWGVFVRTVAVWHITWSVNSVTHIWGYRNFRHRDDSRNNWLVGLVTTAKAGTTTTTPSRVLRLHGQCWWEIDVLLHCHPPLSGSAWSGTW